MNDPAQITSLLNAWRGGDDQTLNQLTPMVYEELKRLARGAFRGEGAGHTLQPPALVHEAFAQLVAADVAWQDRAHFFALSARMMRRILINHATSRNAAKRGGGAVALTLDENYTPGEAADTRLEELDETINELAAFDKRKAELIELQIFGGLSFKEMSEVTGLSSSTLDRELRVAKTWLKQQLAQDQ